MVVYCTRQFWVDLKRLEKHKKEYSTVISDIQKVISKCENWSQLIQLSDILSGQGNGHSLFLLKTRLPNSGQKIGKRGGFRLICYVSAKSKAAYLVHIYPKTGKYGKANFSDDDYNAFSDHFYTDYSNQSLLKLDLTPPSISVENSGEVA